MSPYFYGSEAIHILLQKSRVKFLRWKSESESAQKVVEVVFGKDFTVFFFLQEFKNDVKQRCKINEVTFKARSWIDQLDRGFDFRLKFEFCWIV